MSELHDRINHLERRIELLTSKQNTFQYEIQGLAKELALVKAALNSGVSTVEAKAETPLIKKEPVVPVSILDTRPVSKPIAERVQKPASAINFEKFIGENLINKLGILILLIGVIVGTKYAIDNDLINPLTRIILGYIAGAGLLGFGMYLKAKYETFSAVLVSGAMAAFYFITYIAYDFYQIFPVEFAFVLMVIFTGFTVFAAIQYNQQVIAIIGQVGAYAVPFLLSTGSGKVGVLFGYIAIINTGILFLSLKKYWKIVYVLSFAFTWLIFGAWFADRYDGSYFTLAFVFATIFYLMFYTIFIAYKLVRRESFKALDIILVMLNSFLYYGFGYAMLSEKTLGAELLGVFTVAVALVNFAVSVLFYKTLASDKKLLFLAAGMVLIFITIAIPVQLDGNWVTLLWAGESVLLIWIAKSQKSSMFEKMALPMMLLAASSMVQDWVYFYGSYRLDGTVLLNKVFMTSVLFTIAFAAIAWIHKKYSDASVVVSPKSFTAFNHYIGLGILTVSAYFSTFLEIGFYWDLQFQNTVIKGTTDETYPIYNYDTMLFKSVWLMNYTLMFLSIASILLLKKLKTNVLLHLSLGLNSLAMLIFLSQSLIDLDNLRVQYMEPAHPYFEVTSFHIIIRYVSIFLLAALLTLTVQYKRSEMLEKNLVIPLDLYKHFIILWVLSNELLNVSELLHWKQSYTIGISILWGLYALYLITIGIAGKKKYIRIAAIVLFSITLLKLFLYDVSSMNTIAKTIIFLSLGVLLLVISFLYNKYKHVLFEEDK